MASKPLIRIEVVSDVVCPWCYIGKKRLERAVAAAGDRFDFRVSYLPFELNPGLPAEGVPYRDHLAEKFGGDEQYELLTSRVAAVAGEEGLVLDHGRQEILPNTARLHALIQAAQDPAMQSRLAEAFFRAFFTDGVNLADREKIIGTALGAGMDRNAIERALSDTGLAVRIREQEDQIRSLDIHSVPFYILERKFAVRGAQSAEHFAGVFSRIAAEKHASSRSAPA